jgi:D-alanyl-D-alanine carboxypeptidase (penicillin-binding protein 5/6)
MKGLKTGMTNAACYCLAATASRDGLDLISVTLGSDTNATRFKEASKILDYGFSTFEIMLINRKGETAGNVDVRKGLGISVPVAYEENQAILLRRGQKEKVKEELRLPEYLNAPVAAGDNGGEVVITLDNEVIRKVPLVTTGEVQKATWLKMFWRLAVHWFSMARG